MSYHIQALKIRYRAPSFGYRTCGKFSLPHLQRGLKTFANSTPRSVREYSTFGGTSLKFTQLLPAKHRSRSATSDRNELTLTLKLLRQFGSCASTSSSHIPQPCSSDS